MKTSKQIIEAPLGAIFVWCNKNTDYVFHLIKHLNRQDLIIKSPIWLENGRNFEGVILKLIVLDHALVLTHRQRQGWELALSRVKQ